MDYAAFGDPKILARAKESARSHDEIVDLRRSYAALVRAIVGRRTPKTLVPQMYKQGFFE